MRDDHSGIHAARTAPEAAEQEADEPRASRDAATAGNPAAGPGVERPPRQPDPTRYGDWEKDGRCIDF